MKGYPAFHEVAADFGRNSSLKRSEYTQSTLNEDILDHCIPNNNDKDWITKIDYHALLLAVI